MQGKLTFLWHLYELRVKLKKIVKCSRGAQNTSVVSPVVDQTSAATLSKGENIWNDSECKGCFTLLNLI